MQKVGSRRRGEAADTLGGRGTMVPRLACVYAVACATGAAGFGIVTPGTATPQQRPLASQQPEVAPSQTEVEPT